MSGNHDGVGEELLAALRREGLDGVDRAFAYRQGADLDKPGLGRRRRTRIEIATDDGRTHVLYLKRYGRQAVLAALRRWLTHGRRASAARIEYENILAAREAGVPTMRAAAWGAEPCPIGALRSYLIVTAVPGEAMERCFEAFLARHGDDGRAAEVTIGLARLVRALHDAGYVHRDLYASHVFLDDAGGPPTLHLIDLARMFRPRLRTARWYVRDLAQLKHSMPASWVAGHWRAFLAEYLPGVSDEAAGRFDRRVDRKVASIRRHDERRRRRREGGPRA